MFLVRTPKDGTPLRVYELNWIPGATIAKLPKLAKPLALAYRNARVLLAYVRNCLSRRVPDISAIEVQKNLALGIQYVYEAGVAGDIAEFGTSTATTAYAIAAEMSKLESMYRILYEMRADYRFKPKKLHLFDSFEGLPVAESATDQQSPHVSSGVWGGGYFKAVSAKGLRHVCSRFLTNERTVIYPGWFKDTLPNIQPGTKFSMIHIDCDLYQSAKDVLEYCLSNHLLQEGGAIFFDDWNPNAASPDVGERKAWSEIVQMFNVRYSDWGPYGWGGHKFLVHGYGDSSRI